MGIIASIGAGLTLILELFLLIKDSLRETKRIEGEKLEIRKKEFPKLVEAVGNRDTTAYLLSLSRMRNARKK